MHKPSALTLLASTSLIPSTLAAYTLVESYDPTNFFSKFHFWDKKDPTNGFVQYKPLRSAAESGLIAIDTKSGTVPAIYIGVDNSTKDPAGRASVRISSKKSYNHGLFIFDIEHSPGGICGTWPAFWMLSDGGKWPEGGEIDVFEGANDDRHNKMTLHTTPGCTIQKMSGFSGKVDTPNCDVNAQGQGKNMGCGIKHPVVKTQETFGQGMNKGGGGVWVTSWTSSQISVYHFHRAQVPADINSGKPDPTKWGMPVAKFAEGCAIDKYFKNLNIIFNVAFCGDWAGGAWTQSKGCSAKAPTCQQYVQNNPQVFKDAYWMIRSVKVYQEDAGNQNQKQMQKMKMVGREVQNWISKRWQDFTEVGTVTVDQVREQGPETLEKRGFGDWFKKTWNKAVGWLNRHPTI